MHSHEHTLHILISILFFLLYSAWINSSGGYEKIKTKMYCPMCVHWYRHRSRELWVKHDGAEHINLYLFFRPRVMYAVLVSKFPFEHGPQTAFSVMPHFNAIILLKLFLKSHLTSTWTVFIWNVCVCPTIECDQSAGAFLTLSELRLIQINVNKRIVNILIQTCIMVVTFLKSKNVFRVIYLKTDFILEMTIYTYFQSLYFIILSVRLPSFFFFF